MMKFIFSIAIIGCTSITVIHISDNWFLAKKIEIQNESRKTDIEVNRLIGEVCPEWGEFKNGELRCFKNGKKFNIQEL